MKKIICLLVLIMSLLLTACGGIDFEFGQVGNSITVKANKATDGKYAQSDYFSVNKNQAVKVTSSLTDGQLKIEFIEVVVFHDTDGDVDIIPGALAATVTVGPDETKTVVLEEGEYIMALTAIGTAEGKISTEVVKQ